MRKSLFAALAGIGLVVATGLPAAAATQDRVKTFGSCHAQGDYAICVASGSVNKPLQLWVHVWAKPKQKVNGAWSVICSKGTGVGSESGNINGTTTLSKKLRMNYAHPNSCTASADAQLSGGGKLHIWLTAVKK
jgi:invasion protein IalB